MTDAKKAAYKCAGVQYIRNMKVLAQRLEEALNGLAAAGYAVTHVEQQAHGFILTGEQTTDAGAAQREHPLVALLALGGEKPEAAELVIGEATHRLYARFKHFLTGAQEAPHFEEEVRKAGPFLAQNFSAEELTKAGDEFAAFAQQHAQEHSGNETACRLHERFYTLARVLKDLAKAQLQ